MASTLRPNTQYNSYAQQMAVQNALKSTYSGAFTPTSTPAPAPADEQYGGLTKEQMQQKTRDEAMARALAGGGSTGTAVGGNYTDTVRDILDITGTGDINTLRVAVKPEQPETYQAYKSAITAYDAAAEAALKAGYSGPQIRARAEANYRKRLEQFGVDYIDRNSASGKVGLYDRQLQQYQEDLKYNEALKAKQADVQQAQNEAMLNSPEYQQMQEAIAQQKELVDTQRQQMDMLQGQYEQLQQDYAARDQELTQYLEGLGDQERKALEKQREQMKAAQKEDLMRRGLTSSSALNSELRGIDTMANESLSQMEARLREQKLNYRAQFSGETLAAQRMAAEFGLQSSNTMFEAGTTVPQTMAQLAQMLSNQRQAREQGMTSTAAAALGAEAQRFSAAQSAAASKYATSMNYKSDIAGIKQRESESLRETAFGKQKLQTETQLSYANLRNQLALTALQGENQRRANQALPGKTSWDKLDTGKPGVMGPWG